MPIEVFAVLMSSSGAKETFLPLTVESLIILAISSGLALLIVLAHGYLRRI